MYDAMYVALRLRGPSHNRAVAVVFTDGFDNASWLSEDRLLDAAARSDVIIYGATLGEPVRRADVVSVEKPPAYKFLGSAANVTGGRLFHAATGDKLRDAFARVLEDMRARYLLRYSPDKATPGWHTLEVRLQGARGERQGSGLCPHLRPVASLPMASRWPVVRTYHRPSTKAGDASVCSPSRFTCSSLKSGAGLSTNVSPSSLVK